MIDPVMIRPELEGCLVKAGDQVIGLIAPYTDFLSIYNAYGRHGTPYSQTSMFNKYCKYGGLYGSQSPFNPSTKTPPKIVDHHDNFIAFLTVNPKFMNRVDPRTIGLSPDGIISSGTEADTHEQA